MMFYIEQGDIMNKIDNDIIYKSKQLFSQSFRQEAKDAKETMEKFEELYNENKTNEDVAFIYSKGLLNLVDKLQLDGAISTVEKLKILNTQHKDNQHIAVRYSRGLANLIYKQNAEDAEVSISKLKTLCDEYNDNSEVASGYVGGLENYTIKGGNASEAISIITRLLDLFKDDEGFVKFAEKVVKAINKKLDNNKTVDY